MDYDSAEFDFNRPDGISTECWMNASNDQSRPDSLSTADWIELNGENHFETDEDEHSIQIHDRPVSDRQVIYNLDDAGKVISKINRFEEDADTIMSSHSDDLFSQ